MHIVYTVSGQKITITTIVERAFHGQGPFHSAELCFFAQDGLWFNFKKKIKNYYNIIFC